VDFLQSATKLFLLLMIAFCYCILSPYQTLAGISSPPPNNLSIQIISINEPTCPFDNGYIEVDILTGDPDFTIDLILNNVVVYTATVGYTGLYVVPNIGPGTYVLRVTDATPDVAAHGFKIDDITNFPFVPFNSDRAFGIDVKTDVQSNVFATGFGVRSLFQEDFSL
jgi:hypothetical protein